MTFYEFVLRFASEHPFLTFCFGVGLFGLLTWPFRLVNRLFRHRNIVAQGWPPQYCDADGDAVDLDEDD